MIRRLKNMKPLQLVILGLMLVGIALQLFFVVNGPALVAVFLAMPIAFGPLLIIQISKKEDVG